MSDSKKHPNHSPEPVPESPADTSANEPAAKQAVPDSPDTEAAAGNDGQTAKQGADAAVSADEEQREALERTSRERMSRGVLFVLLVGLALLFIPIVKVFFLPLVLAATFSTLFFPYYRWLLKAFRGHKGLGSLACCATLLLGLLAPTYLLGHLVTLQTIDLYATAQPKVRQIIRKADQGQLGQLRNSRVVRTLRLDRLDLQSSITDGVRAAGKLGTTIVNRTSAGVFSLLANGAIMLFTMFYFFMDGEQLVRRIRYLSPLRDEYEEMLLSRFLLISRATVKGTVLVGLTQGAIGAVALLIFGVKSWLLWGFVMVILSIIPLVGAWLVMIPASVVQVLLGHYWQGIGIFLASTVVISNLDNLIRPRLVGRDAKMHDLLIFFATLGGISVFGIMGFIVGPVIAALFVTVLDIYGMEFRSQLTSPETDNYETWHV